MVARTFPAEVVRDALIQNAWRVEKLDADGDGTPDVTIFFGSDAHQRAVEYASDRYGLVRRCP